MATHTNVQQSAPPPLISINDASDEHLMTISTSRTNRQTKAKEEIDIQFKVLCYEGIPELHIKENQQDWKPAKKSDLHKLKKEVIQNILQHLFGYEDIKQNKGILEKILYASCGIEDDPGLIAIKILNDENKPKIIESLEQELTVLSFDIFESISDPPKELQSDNGFIESCYQYLYDDHQTLLLNFIELLWNKLTLIWIKHPTDIEYIDKSITFIASYHECQEYILLSQAFTTLQNMETYEFNHLTFSSFAFGLYLHIDKIFRTEIIKSIMQIIDRLNLNHSPTGKKLNEEELFYLRQSMGGATVNSRLRIYYGCGFGKLKKQMLILIIRSLLLDSANPTNSRIAFRLKIENRGHLRLINERATEWVGKVMTLIKPKLFNIVLMYKGKFKCILDELLQNEDLRHAYQQLFDCAKLLDAFKLVSATDDDIDMKDSNCNDTLDDMEIKHLLNESMDRTFKDFVCGIFTRSIWGYLKPLRPTANTISLRNSLKLCFGSSKKKYSPLQTDND